MKFKALAYLDHNRQVVMAPYICLWFFGWWSFRIGQTVRLYGMDPKYHGDPYIYGDCR